ncbi:MAG: LPS export ABC transporter periplasmic protein LptC [Burkholderiales bacterium]|nr:LPS export ABC transporter periplasmic protein LptC [Burkholderiales bacterium]
MHKFYSSKAFQFFAIAIISSLCLLLNSLTIINFHKMELPKANPQYNATGIDGSVYEKSGKLLYNMQGESAWEYPDDSKIYLKNLRIDVYNKSKDLVDYSIKSNDGWIDHVEKIGYLGKNTVVTIANNDSQKTINLYSESINLNFDKNSFNSRANLHAVQGKSTLDTRGFSYDGVKQFLILESAVKVVYVQ